jgi:hypothetical protein
MNSAGAGGAELTGMRTVMLASMFPDYLLLDIQKTIGEERNRRCRLKFREQPDRRTGAD